MPRRREQSSGTPRGPRTATTLGAGQPASTEVRAVPDTVDPAAGARHRIPLTGGRTGSRDAGDLGHVLLGLGLPAGEEDPQAPGIPCAARVEEMQQAVGVHGRDATKLDREVPRIAAYTIRK